MASTAKNTHLKARSYKVYKWGLRNGIVTREPCEICHNPKTSGHHTDYAYPMRVVWLCDRHHGKAHRSGPTMRFSSQERRPDETDPLVQEMREFERQCAHGRSVIDGMVAAHAMGRAYTSLSAEELAAMKTGPTLEGRDEYKSAVIGAFIIREPSCD